MRSHQLPRASTSASVAIRPMCAEDLSAIVALDTHRSGEPRPAYFARRLALLGGTESVNHTLGLVAELDGEVVGLIMGTLTSGEFGFAQVTALIDWIDVAPDQQRHGVGERLASAFLAEVAAHGALEVYTLVNWNAWDILKFFGALGFELAMTIPLRRQVS